MERLTHARRLPQRCHAGRLRARRLRALAGLCHVLLHQQVEHEDLVVGHRGAGRDPQHLVAPARIQAACQGSDAQHLRTIGLRQRAGEERLDLWASQRAVQPTEAGSIGGHEQWRAARSRAEDDGGALDGREALVKHEVGVALELSPEPVQGVRAEEHVVALRE
jgi:hypothetical protein